MPSRLRRAPRLAAFAIVVLLAARVAVGAAPDEFAKLLDDHWEFTLRESPLFATSTGDFRYNDQLDRVSLADAQRRHAAQQEFIRRLDGMQAAELPASDRVNYALFKRGLEDELEEYEFLTHLTPVNNRSGFHIRFPELRREVPLKTVEDFENYIARLHGFKAYAEGHLELMREGIRRGVTMPAVIMEGWRDSVAAHVVDDPTNSLLYAPFHKLPSTVAPEERDRLCAAAKQAITESVVEGYRRFEKFMAEEYVPQCRGTIAASALPRGRDFYRHRVVKFTTLDISPKEVHQRGLDEVERIRAEMHQIIRRVEFDGDFAAFTEFLRTDPQFYAKAPEELLAKCSLILKRADGKLPDLFGRLPRMPYGLKEVPAYIAPKTTSAYYERPSGDRSKAGFYFLNTYNLPARPLYTLEALSLHEAVPGHHLQLALQQEMEDQPTFRKYGGFTAFIEGWALYSERLGLEMGFYQDPYSDFGRLTMEMWRACRLVVDTGVHYQGWTRQQAIDFMKDNSAMSEHNIRAEVDRYIGWPGQALAYKTGELKIRQLRQMAEERLGERFDLRAFHDVVLGSGAVSLDLLERNVERWVEQME